MKKHHVFQLGILAMAALLGLPGLLGLSPAVTGAGATANPTVVPPVAPAVIGDWQGAIDTGGGLLRIVVHIAQDIDSKLAASMDSPDQGATGIAVSSISFKQPDLHFEIERIGGSYDGKINQGSTEIAGNWKQGSASLPLTLKRAGK